MSSVVAKTLLAAALFGASLTGVAYARDQVVTARLAAPATQTRVIADNTLWSCEGDTCVAALHHDATVRVCHQFARQAGAAVVSFGPADAQLSAEDLARCNGDAGTTQQARN